MRQEEHSFFYDIAAFKKVCNNRSWTNLDTSLQSCCSSNKKQEMGRNKKFQWNNQSLETTLEGGSFLQKEEKVHSSQQHSCEQNKIIRRRLVQEAYEELKQYYLLQKQRQKQWISEQGQNDNDNVKKTFQNMQNAYHQSNNQTFNSEIQNKISEKQKFAELTKLTEDDELILLLKFVIGKKSNNIPWTILPITEDQAYLYIEQHQQHLRNLYDSKLNIFMRNIIALYQYPNITVVTLFLMLFKQYGMKFDIQNQQPDFMNKKVIRGMFGIQFHSVSYNFESFDSQQEY